MHVRWSLKRPALATALLLVFVATRAVAQVPLTLAEALRLAESRAPALAAADAGARSARELSVAAGQLPDPVLRAGIDNLPVSGPDAWSLERDFMTMRRVGVMQEYVSAAKRATRRERGDRESKRWEAEREMTRAEVRVDVAAAWYDRLYARRSERLLRDLIDEIGMQERAAQAQVASGKASAADVLALRAARVQAEDRTAIVRSQQQAAVARLARWLGPDAERSPTDEPPTPGDLELRAIERHSSLDTPHLRLLASQVEMADADVRVAEANRTPNWSWEVSYAQRGPAYSNMISVGFSVPLPIDRHERQDRELAARVAQRDQARESLEDAKRKHEATFNAMRVEWQATRERQRRLESALMPLAQQRVEAALAAYRGGQQGLAAVLDVRRAEVDARLQILDVEREAARLWAQLRYTYLDRADTHELPAGAKP